MPTATISYITGDATAPLGTGPKVIVHVCNDKGGWGRGFVLALTARWPEPEAAYRAWHAEGDAEDFALGTVRFVEVDRELWVANLIGQHGVKTVDGVPPVRYDAIRLGFQRVAEFTASHEASVHMPRLGCGLAGGEWDRVEPLINEEIIAQGLSATVYDLPEK